MRKTVLSQFVVATLFLGFASLRAQSPAGPDAKKPLTVEAIFSHGHLIGDPPEDLTWSPNGKHLTYLDGGELIDLEPGLDGGGGKPHVMVSRANWLRLKARTAQRRTAIIASATKWRATFGRRTHRICCSIRTDGCGFMTCTTALEFRWALRLRVGRRSKVLSQWRISFLHPRPWSFGSAD